MSLCSPYYEYELNGCSRTEPKVKAEPASERSDKQLDDVEDGEEVEIPLTGPSDDQV